ncbi:hypothetical protein GCM10028807_03900 [Spirosoma daeguense]
MGNRKVWFITGISKGLGKEIAKIVHGNGDQVIGIVREESDKNRLEIELVGAKIYILDLLQSEKINVVIEDIIKSFTKIDMLINNAGYGLFGLFEEVSAEELRKQFEVNVFAKWILINVYFPI